MTHWLGGARWVATPMLLLGCLAPLRGGSGLTVAAPPELWATIWKRELLVAEPVLVRLELSNPSTEPLAVVPPYVNVWGLTAWPLAFTITDEAGRRVPSGWEYARTGFEPICFGAPWWIAAGGPGRPPLREAWQLPAGGRGWMWIDLLQFYPLDEPARYHVVFQYDAQPEMLVSLGWTEPPPEGVWSGHLEADAEWITVHEPGDADRDAAQFLLERRDKLQAVLSAGAYGVAPAVLERFPQAAHALYAAFYQHWSPGVFGGPPATGAEKLAASAAGFAREHPEFPLNYQLPVAAALSQWQVAAEVVLMAAGMGMEPTEEMVARAAERRGVLREAAAVARDYSLMQMVEDRISLLAVPGMATAP